MLGFGGKKASDNGPNSKGAHVVVIGNEKGGSGKSTTTMHMIVALLQQGRNVASIDVDARKARSADTSRTENVSSKFREQM